MLAVGRFLYFWEVKKKTALILAILFPVQVVAIRLLAGYPHFVEQWYSKGIYPLTSSLMRMGLGFLPFSLGDLLYAGFVIFMVRWLVIRFRQRFRKLLKWLLEAMATFSVIYACFNIFWGLNYYRPPLHQTLEIEHEYSTEELQRLTEILVERSNEIHFSITQNDTVKVDIPYSKNELFAFTVTGFENLQTDFPELAYNQTSLKRSLYSVPLSYMGFNGYLNPLTNEGQVNTVIVPFKIPTTASHEVGHQLGFAAENEANFIACLATMRHPDIYFQYSGYTFALSYCMNELYRREPELAEQLVDKINPGIRKNYAEVQEFWLAHKNPFEPLFMAFYNSFLEANAQQGGMKSYSYVVALLVNYFQEEDQL